MATTMTPVTAPALTHFDGTPAHPRVVDAARALMANRCWPDGTTLETLPPAERKEFLEDAATVLTSAGLYDASLAGTPAPPDSRTLAECLGELDSILARVSVFRSAVQRLPGDRELTVIRLDYMAANIREAIEDGDRAAQSWRAGS